VRVCIRRPIRSGKQRGHDGEDAAARRLSA
jgi:hypothetical protein